MLRIYRPEIDQVTQCRVVYWFPLFPLGGILLVCCRWLGALLAMRRESD